MQAVPLHGKPDPGAASDVPFADAVSPHALYQHDAFQDALAQLAQAKISDREGITLITGPAGSGKTSLLARLLAEPELAEGSLCLSGDEELTFSGFLKLCAEGFGLPAEFADAKAHLRALSAFLVERARSGRSSTIVIDPADKLNSRFLGELSEFATWSKSGRRLSNVILTGRGTPGGQAGPDFAGVKIALHCHLAPIPAEDVAGYLAHRLEIAGESRPQLLEPAVVARIAEISGGLPAKINRLAREVLRLSEAAGVERIDGDLVGECGRALEQGEGFESWEGADLSASGAVETPSDDEPAWPLDLSMSDAVAVRDPDLDPEARLEDPARPLNGGLNGRLNGHRIWVALGSCGLAAALLLAAALHQTWPQKIAGLLESYVSTTPFGSPEPLPAEATEPPAPAIASREPTGEAALPYATRLSEPGSAFLAVKAPRGLEDTSGLGAARALPRSLSAYEREAVEDPDDLDPGLMPVIDARPGQQPSHDKIVHALTQPLLSVSAGDGREDEPIALQVTAGVDVEQSLTEVKVTIAGLPPGGRLSAGRVDESGLWHLEPVDLSDLSLLPPTDFSGSFGLAISATARRPEGETAYATLALPIKVAAVPDVPLLRTSALEGSEDEALAMEIDAGLVDGDGSEVLTVFIYDLPDGSELSAGKTQGDGSWRLAPEDLSGLRLSPRANLSGVFTLTVVALASEREGGSTPAKLPVVLTILPVADPPQLTIAPVAGLENEALTLALAASLSDTDGSESLSLLFAGLPEGARLSAGQDDGDGRWRVMETELAGVQILPPANWSGGFELKVTAVAREIGGGEASVSERIPVRFDAAPNAPELLVQAAVGLEGEELPLSIEAHSPNPDAAELQKIVVSGLPPGARLSAGEADEDGSWHLAPEDLMGLRLIPTPGFTGEAELTVRAETQEAGETLQAEAKLPLSLAPGLDVEIDDFVISKGDSHLAAKELTSARHYYQQAIDQGIATAMTALGETYDPIELARLGIDDAESDPDLARHWYLRGIAAGDLDALKRLQALSERE